MLYLGEYRLDTLRYGIFNIRHKEIKKDKGKKENEHGKNVRTVKPFGLSGSGT